MQSICFGRGGGFVQGPQFAGYRVYNLCARSVSGVLQQPLLRFGADLCCPCRVYGLCNQFCWICVVRVGFTVCAINFVVWLQVCAINFVVWLRFVQSILLFGYGWFVGSIPKQPSLHFVANPSRFGADLCFGFRLYDFRVWGIVFSVSFSCVTASHGAWGRCDHLGTCCFEVLLLSELGNVGFCIAVVLWSSGSC